MWMQEGKLLKQKNPGILGPSQDIYWSGLSGLASFIVE